MLLERLEKLKEAGIAGIVSDPARLVSRAETPGEMRSMMSIATLALGLAIFGLFFAMVAGLRPTLNRRTLRMLYLTGVLTVAALIYLAYVMIFPEKF